MECLLPCVFYVRASVIIVVLWLPLSSCDTYDSESFEGCPPEPAAGFDSYFPLDEAVDLSYEYEEFYRPPASLPQVLESTTGTLTWSFDPSEATCSGKTAFFHVQEKIVATFKRFTEGTGESVEGEQRHSERTLLVLLEQGRLVIPGYTDIFDNVYWSYPSEAPDTIVADTSYTVSRSTRTIRLALIRGVGLDEWQTAVSGIGTAGGGIRERRIKLRLGDN